MPDSSTTPASKVSFPGDLFTLPNLLTLFRAGLGIAFPWLPVNARGPVIVVGALTDLFDGALGRNFGLCSRTGRILDPLADKIFVVGVLAALLRDGTLVWPELLLLLARDLVVIVGVLIGLTLRSWSAFRTMAPTLLGKATTAAQFLYLAVLVFAPAARDWLYPVAAGISVAAGVQYLWLFLEHRRAI